MTSFLGKTCTVCKRGYAAHFRMEIECEGDPEPGQMWVCDLCYRAIEALLIAINVKYTTKGSA